ncbi:MAG: hypothetical protein RJA02_2075 [Armatimonadota bacterium]|jgi:hypothetical protein
MPVSPETNIATRDTFLTTVDEKYTALVTEIDATIRAVSAELEGYISYKMLMYRVGLKRSDWLIAIDARGTKCVTLRFFKGVHFLDTEKLLRLGTTTIGNLDFTISLTETDKANIVDFTKQAIAWHTNEASQKLD